MADDQQTLEAEWFELARFANGEEFEEFRAVLDDAGIRYRLGTTAAVFDFSTIGSDRDTKVIVSVPAAGYEAAREAIERVYLDTPLPDDHHLQDASEEEILDIIANAPDWSAFDVAHAKRLATERGFCEEEVEARSEARMESLKEGKAASPLLLGFAFLSAVLGGIAGVAIGYSLCTMKERTPEGEFFTYDEASRRAGHGLLIFGLIVLLSMLVYLLVQQNQAF